MTAQLNWLPEALEDVGRLYEFLRDKDKQAADECILTVLDRTKLLKGSPRLGRPMPDETGRRELFIAFGAGAYVIRYRLEDTETVTIIRVWHSRESR
jgi:plasmid stabilization system protein ParE